MKKYIKINSDVFNIVTRIKSLNKNYFVLFNKITNTFELHTKERPNNSFELTLPRGNLDVRTISFIQKQLNRNVLQVIKEVEEHNKNLENKKNAAILEESAYKLKEIYAYAQKGAKSYEHNKSYQTKWF